MASHIQMFAMSRWLPLVLPVEYYEFSRGLQWSVPYFNLPWETGQMQQFMVGSSSPSDNSYSSRIHDSGLFHGVKPDLENVGIDPTVYGLPLTPMEYGSIFEVRNHCVYKHLASFPLISSDRSHFSLADPKCFARSWVHLGSTKFKWVSV